MTVSGHRAEVSCSFCGKKQSEVNKLVAGPDGVYICNECVSLCVEIMREEGVEFPPTGQ